MNDDDDDDELFFVVWLTNERRLALFPVGTIVKDPHHRESAQNLSSDLVEWNSFNINIIALVLFCSTKGFNVKISLFLIIFPNDIKYLG